jgi:NTE family protein
MTESKSLDPARRRRRVALALQGGGAHGAFGWGVLDRLLENGLRVEAICGVSSGAITGAMLAQGLVKGGAEGGRAELHRLWETLAHGRGGAAVDAWLWGPDLLGDLVWQGMETMMRLFSPAQINPMGHNPLRPLLASLLEPDTLRRPGAPRFYAAATDIRSGEAVLFGNDSITVEVLLASACVPFLFPPIEVNGRPYWDGGCAGNPPLAPLLSPVLPDELVVIRAHPVQRETVPRSPAEIINRLNEIACHNVLRAELARVPRACRVRIFDADTALGDLPLSSKFRADRGVLRALFGAGRTAAESAAMDLAAWA